MPVSRSPSPERIAEIDVIRGIALFGVLIVNFVTIFRVSMFLQIETFHTEPGAANAAADWFIGMAIESKAFAIFSLLFGVSAAIFRERNGTAMLARRFAILLAFGLAHLVLIWNGDILTAYALAGLLALPLLGKRAAAVAIAVVALFYCLPLPIPDPLPHGAAAVEHGTLAAFVYGKGTWLEILRFRTYETQRFIIPLLALTFPRIFAMILLGDLAWRRGLPRKPEEHLRLIRRVTAGGLALGGGATALGAWAASTGHDLGRAWPLVSSLANVPLALGYVGGLVLLLRRPAIRRVCVAFFAPVGRMAFTNYIAQSVLGSLLFYGFGLGLFGRIGSGACLAVCVTVYLVQAAFSRVWLRRFAFGPLEWAWRRLTYA